MIVLLGKKLITDKEASSRYGYSQEWFRKRRYQKKKPPYYKIEGKIYYDIEELDQWFKEKLCKY